MTDPTNPGTDFGAAASELAQLRTEVAELRAEIARLDADLDESRRLNLRAAELLDIVYETLGRTQGLSE
jgi:cell division protein FtsB